MIVSKIDAGMFTHKCLNKGEGKWIRALLQTAKSTVEAVEAVIGPRWGSVYWDLDEPKPYEVEHACCQRRIKRIFRPYEDWFERTIREYRLPGNDYTRLPDYVLLGGGGPPGMKLLYEAHN